MSQNGLSEHHPSHLLIDMCHLYVITVNFDLHNKSVTSIAHPPNPGFSTTVIISPPSEDFFGVVLQLPVQVHPAIRVPGAINTETVKIKRVHIANPLISTPQDVFRHQSPSLHGCGAQGGGFLALVRS